MLKIQLKTKTNTVDPCRSRSSSWPGRIPPLRERYIETRFLSPPPYRELRPFTRICRRVARARRPGRGGRLGTHVRARRTTALRRGPRKPVGGTARVSPMAFGPAGSHNNLTVAIIMSRYGPVAAAPGVRQRVADGSRAS